MVKKSYKDLFFVLAVFTALFCIFFFTPYVTDDYAEKLSVMNITWPECFKSALLYGNGRILGNLGLLSSLHSDLLRILSKPMFVTALICSFTYLFDIKTLFGKLAVCALLIIPAKGFFSSCYIENPCFYNYVVPICLFAVCLAIIKYSKKNNKIRWIMAFILLFLSFCMQLFSENSSIIFFLLAVGLCIYEYSSEKKLSIFSAALITGAVIGLAVMLILPNYLSSNYELKYDMSEYRHVFFSIPYIIGTLSQFCEIFSSSFIVIAFLSAIEIFIVIKESPEDKLKKWHIVVPVFYSIICLLYSFTQNDERKIIASVKLAFLGLFIVFLVNSVVIFFRFIKSKENKAVLGFLIFISMISAGMFTVLTQHSYRTFYLSVCLVTAIAFYLLKIIRKEYDIVDTAIEKAKSVLNASMAIAFVCFTVILTCQMIQNYNVSLMREYYIAEKIEQGETEIRVPKLPNKRLCREEYMSMFKEHMKNYYGEAEYVFVDIEDWELYETYQSMQDNPFTSLTYAFENFNFNKPLK